jgi:hypothetical protein
VINLQNTPPKSVTDGAVSDILGFVKNFILTVLKRAKA